MEQQVALPWTSPRRSVSVNNERLVRVLLRKVAGVPFALRLALDPPKQRTWVPGRMTLSESESMSPVAVPRRLDFLRFMCNKTVCVSSNTEEISLHSVVLPSMPKALYFSV